ncbi:MAG TPA: sugar phosphate isomerase/epimerase [Capsulimonadaceae bacterium]|jgi:sugar phosphate isomerase/epimerase
MIRLGGDLDIGGETDPDRLAAMHTEFGYTAAYGPYVPVSDTAYIRSYRKAFAAKDIVIAEVGIWKNMIAPEDDIRKANFEYACERFALAEEVGALCCINFIGSVAPGERRGPHPDNLTKYGFELCVDTIRGLIDTVKPTRTKFCLEMMQFLLPDSPEVYLDIVKAVDRAAFGVHLDPVNIILTPRDYFNNGNLIRRCFDVLGPWVVSCHAKDITLVDRLALHMDETIPGKGNLDYAVFLSAISELPRDTPLMLEHLQRGEYAVARDHITTVAKNNGIRLYEATPTH